MMKKTYCLLFNGKHVVIEESVKLLVCIVDTQLFKAVGLKEKVTGHRSIIGKTSVNQGCTKG